ncbi:MAG TPA: DAK2 domain-containing protein [bacterium]|nr:DAK2 domain-containing protein [bacterium]
MTTAAEALAAIASDVIADRDELNRLDAVAGDGDLGVTIAAVAAAVMSTVQQSPGDGDLATLLRGCGMAIARQAASTSGTLIATGFLRAAAAVARPADSETARLASAVEASVVGIQERGKAAVGDKTMLDALVPAAEALRTAADEGASLLAAVEQAAAAADRAARATVEMRPKVGRASWLADRSEGHIDPGAYLVALTLGCAVRWLRSQNT